MGGSAKQVARYAALAALFLIPVTPLIVANFLFFPFITGKAFYLRTLVEVAVAAWVVLLFLDRRYRPRFSPIGATAVLLVLWMLVADSFAPNAVKAFWSNFERMEGWILLIHLLGFFFASSAVLRVEQKWRAWFLTAVGVSLVVSLYALLQMSGAAAIHQGSTRIDASLGNSAYLAIYLLFSACTAAWLALTEKRLWLTWSLLALAALEALLIFFTETRGTIVALVLAALVAASLTAFTAGRRVRLYALGALALILIAIGGLYLARDSSFVQNNHTLERLTSISLADGQVRFTIWRMAFAGVRERPLVGWGQEGFNYIFNTYYDPALYAQEPWFDRAHNAFIDWLTAGGIPALLFYLALFAAAFWLLWTRNELSRAERIALTAALVGYAVHNIFIFDNLSSYLYFFALLALIDSQTARPIRQLEAAPEVPPADGMTYLLPVTFAVMLVIMWFVNVRGMNVAAGLISALSSGEISASLSQLAGLSAAPAFAGQEVREQIVSYARQVVQSQQVPDSEKARASALAVSEIQKEVAAYPNDARAHMQLAYAHSASGDTGKALAELETASALSPKKQAILVEMGLIELDRGNIEAARTHFLTAYTLTPQFSDLALYVAAADFAARRVAQAEARLREAFGTTTVDSNVLAVIYYRTKDWPRLVALWEKRAAQPGANAQVWYSLALVHYLSGNRPRALRTVDEAARRFPETAATAAAARAEIEAGPAQP